MSNIACYYFFQPGDVEVLKPGQVGLRTLLAITSTQSSNKVQRNTFDKGLLISNVKPGREI